MSLAILFHLLCAQHVSDINISIFRNLLQPAKRTPPKTSHTRSSNTKRTENKTTDVVTHQHSRKLLKMDILMSETCWAHKKWNKIASDIKLILHSSTIAMMHGPINIRISKLSLVYLPPRQDGVACRRPYTIVNRLTTFLFTKTSKWHSIVRSAISCKASLSRGLQCQYSVMEIHKLVFVNRRSNLERIYNAVITQNLCLFMED